MLVLAVILKLLKNAIFPSQTIGLPDLIVGLVVAPLVFFGVFCILHDRLGHKGIHLALIDGSAITIELHGRRGRTALVRDINELLRTRMADVRGG